MIAAEDTITMHWGKLHFIIIGSLTLLIFVTGCDMAPNTDPEPPTGGQRYAMDYDVFAAEIDTILTAHGCDNDYCHGGGIRGTFQLSPSTDKDIHFDFLQVSLQVTPADPEGSPVLVKPLAESGGGIAHTADSSRYGFLSTDDPHYQAILAWIEAGEYQ
jgi:hypothetical protein